MFTDYILANPSGNITALVTTPLKDEDRRSVIKEIFDNEPTCEQVGFVEFIDENSISLEMMGGEFCGNATISAAAFLAESYCMPVYEDMNVNVFSPVVGRPLSVHVIRKKDAVLEQLNEYAGTAADKPEGKKSQVLEKHNYVGTVEMPTPIVDEFHEYPIVHMSGISHILIPANVMTHEEAEQLVKEYASELDVLALGIVLYSVQSLSRIDIEPIVYVKGTDTLFWEHGCATGSTAVAYYRFVHDGIKRTEVSQPGGVITIDIKKGAPKMTGGILL